MRAILVLNNHNVQDLKILVDLTERFLERQVASLLERHQEREAFQILRHRAKFIARIPMGKRALAKADVTLFEDLL